jgi:hypothetical protein
MNNIDYESQTEEVSQHATDVLVTQIILSLMIIVSVFVLNIFHPELSEYLITQFKHYSNMEFSETLRYLLRGIYDRV